MKINYSKRFFRDSDTDETFIYHIPLLDVSVESEKQKGPIIRCYLDTGALVNVFPWEYGISCLGFTNKSIEVGSKINLVGVGGTNQTAYGHVCTLSIGNLELQRVMIYFLKNQPFPLLGRVGFMDLFNKIIFNERDQYLELID